MIYRAQDVPATTNEYILDKFTSFSTNEKVISQFGKFTYAVIDPPIATPISTISFYPNEEEVLLPPCTRLIKVSDGVYEVSSRRERTRVNKTVSTGICLCCYTCCICVPLILSTCGLTIGLCAEICGPCNLCCHWCCFMQSQYSNLMINTCLYCELNVPTVEEYVERAHSKEEAQKACCLLCIPGYSMIMGLYFGFCLFCPWMNSEMKSFNPETDSLLKN